MRKQRAGSSTGHSELPLRLPKLKTGNFSSAVKYAKFAIKVQLQMAVADELQQIKLMTNGRNYPKTRTLITPSLNSSRNISA
ncbi:hypothetical protein [Pseudomonas sp. zfem005]|uniref:hypothetical protein n=1 Tax=Pseudomonas sp. zfem005 TaxID=3078200 RepID=UPI002929E8DF|nr:hypothetical protein [Pseudomonas sp. zfem005]MDU9412568.1 hypothetical protein [Pseudomonas sp. zfem005]